MTDTSESIIDEFLDGEPVDPVRLADVLAGAGARQYLADVLVLRGIVRSEPGADASSVPARPPAPSRLRIAAASAVLVTGALGFGLGWRAAGSGIGSIDPADGPTVAVSESAPEPTAVIRLESGIDWDERRW
jgi:hypothetical protein